MNETSRGCSHCCSSRDLSFEGLHIATALENCAPLDVEEADAGVLMHHCCCGSPPREVLYTRRDLLQNSEVLPRCGMSAQIKNAVSNSFNSFVSNALGKRMRDLVDAST